MISFGQLITMACSSPVSVRNWGFFLLLVIFLRHHHLQLSHIVNLFDVYHLFFSIKGDFHNIIYHICLFYNLVN